MDRNATRPYLLAFVGSGLLTAAAYGVAFALGSKFSSLGGAWGWVFPVVVLLMVFGPILTLVCLAAAVFRKTDDDRVTRRRSEPKHF